MEEYMKVIGIRTLKKVKDMNYIKMDKLMKDFISMVNLREMVDLYGQMAKAMMVNGNKD